MNSDRKSMWCPLMHDMCTDGWCKSMEKGKRKGPSPKCRFWIGIEGTHPQKKEPVVDHDCAIAWQPTLMLEQARVQNSTGSAVESLRNRVKDTVDAIKELGHKSVLLVDHNKDKPTVVDATPEPEKIEHKGGDGTKEEKE